MSRLKTKLGASFLAAALSLAGVGTLASAAPAMAKHGKHGHHHSKKKNKKANSSGDNSTTNSAGRNNTSATNNNEQTSTVNIYQGQEVNSTAGRGGDGGDGGDSGDASCTSVDPAVGLGVLGFGAAGSKTECETGAGGDGGEGGDSNSVVLAGSHNETGTVTNSNYNGGAAAGSTDNSCTSTSEEGDTFCSSNPAPRPGV